jgi:ribonucleoside-diphosphate reductase alpha chain/ribonucleoside-triphosphate reductase
MQEYVDHNASITVHVREDEWDDVEQWLWDNWEYVFGVSFLPYSDSFYDLMPYEECSKEEYEELAEKMGTFKPSLVNKYEKAHQKERELDNDGCEEGVCPVR